MMWWNTTGLVSGGRERERETETERDRETKTERETKRHREKNHYFLLSPTPLVELTNSQVALQGVEVKGYIICSSYVAQVFGRDHHPQWREGDLVSKRSWIAKVQDLQYFATVGPPPPGNLIPWLPLSVIQPSAVRTPTDTPTDKESVMATLLSQLGPDTQSIGKSLAIFSSCCYI